MFHIMMRIFFFASILSSFSGLQAGSCPATLSVQENQESTAKKCGSHNCGPLIGDIVPSFTAKSTQGDIHFPDQYQGKWIILFSHPADFTPVCTTEFKRLAEINNDLKQVNCQLVGLSVDDTYTHKIWLQSLGLDGKDVDPRRKVDFPIIADTEGKVARLYGMIHPNESLTQTTRSIYFIDPAHKVRAIFHYPHLNGRNFDEMKRLLFALQATDREGGATPSNWQPGDKVIPKEEVTKDVMPD